jgi:hypothetical protein
MGNKTYIEYADYNELIEILNRSNHETSYQDLMQKEKNTLDTVNAVVKHYRDKNIQEKEFINRPVLENISRFWLDMNLLVKELMDLTHPRDIVPLLTKGERIIYFGFICISLAIILFFVEISK